MAWNDALSDEQQDAAASSDRFVRLLAGPGTGKTRTLTQRVAYLQEVEKIPAEDILLLTFSRAAARELKERLEAAGAAVPRVSTLHGFALRQLLRNGAAPDLPEPIAIADDFDERWVIHEDLKALLDRHVRDVQRSLQDLASDWETLAADSDEWEKNHPDAAFLGAFREHRTIFGYTLRSELVYRVKRALLEQPAFKLERDFTHVLVDEYQDLNKCELAVIEAIVDRGASLFVAGDDDQSIYGFRHAFPQGIRDFLSDFPGAVGIEVEVCHRCGRRILDIALNVARQDPHREEKKLRVPDGAAEGIADVLVFGDGEDEALGVARLCEWLVKVEQVPPGEILILQRMDRNHVFSEPILQRLEKLGLEGTRVSNPFAILEEGDGRMIVCALRLLVNRQDSLAWRELLELRSNRVGRRLLEKVYELAVERGLSFSGALELLRSDHDAIDAGNKNRLFEDLDAIDHMLAGLDGLKDRPLEEALAELVKQVIGGSMEEFATVLFLIAGEDTDSLEGVLERLQAVRDFVEALSREGEHDAIRFMSMHAAKGLTATAVIIPNAEDELLPGNATGERELGDERRLLYVSLTRAKRYLFVTYAGGRAGGQARSGRASSMHSLCRFLSGIATPRSGSAYIKSLPA